MLETLYLESINVGHIETISHDRRPLSTGICNYPVDGPVPVYEMGLHNDAMVDTEHHGGANQAIYAYSADDYDWWMDRRTVTTHPDSSARSRGAIR